MLGKSEKGSTNRSGSLQCWREWENTEILMAVGGMVEDDAGE